MSDLAPYAAVILAGGRARRLGGAAKPELRVGGTRLIDLVIAAVHDAETVIVVGPDPNLARGVLLTREKPAGAGPVAAIAAGLPHIESPVTVLLAADLPFIAPAVPRLREALGPNTRPNDAAALYDATGRLNGLAAAWHTEALRAALSRLGDPAGAAVRSLYATATVARISDTDGWTQDCDTPEQLAEARRRAEA